MLIRRSAIRTIPVTVIRQLAPALPSDAPVADFVESAGEIAVGENHLGIVTGYASRQVFGLIATANQLRSGALLEQSVEQCDKVIWTVIHGSVIVRLYWKDCQQDIEGSLNNCWRSPCKNRELSGSMPVSPSTSGPARFANG